MNIGNTIFVSSIILKGEYTHLGSLELLAPIPKADLEVGKNYHVWIMESVTPLMGIPMTHVRIFEEGELWNHECHAFRSEEECLSQWFDVDNPHDFDTWFEAL